MHKIYLLLRNNKQSGPYSLDEMIDMGLKPFDLVWVEGKSAGWRYPEEIDALKELFEPVSQLSIQSNKIDPKFKEQISFQKNNHIEEVIPIRATIQNSSRHIFVSLPGSASAKIKLEPEVNNSESYNYNNTAKIEDCREFKVDQSFNSEEGQSKIIETKLSRSLEDAEKDYTNWIFTKRKKGLQLEGNQVLLIGLGILLIAGGYIGVSRFISLNKNDQPQTGKNLPAQNKTLIAKENQIENQPVAEKKPANNLTVAESGPVKDISGLPPQLKKTKSPAKGIKLIRHNTPIEKQSRQQQVYHRIINTNPNGNSIQVATPVKRTEMENTVKKKKISDFFNNVFRKRNSNKKSEPETNTTASIPQQMPGERKSTKRDEVSSSDAEPQEDLVELSSNERSDSWQLGIYNLKLTLRNRNPVSVKNAEVEVIYFDENDRILEKRKLYFNNISSKGSLTLKAPDQKWADHVEYAVVALH